MSNTTKTFDINAIREEFPILNQKIHNKPLVYLDNAATTQKPKVVIEAISDYYSWYNANIHRGIHTLAEKATEAYEATRKKIQTLINANYSEEVIFTRGTTESINLVASSLGRMVLSEGDEILISGMEHHSNIVPWQLIAEQKGASIKVIPVLENGELDLEAFYKLLNSKTKIVSVVYVSNSLGTINPVKVIVEASKKFGAYTLIDAAQATAHLGIDVQEIDSDFVAFSSHKVYGPTGVGVLYGRKSLLEKMPPYQGGGEMIAEVSFEKSTYNELPYKFEAGTPNIADTIAFSAALDFLLKIKDSALAHEDELLKYGTEKLSQIDGLRLIGQAKNKISILSFVLDGVHPQDAGILLDQLGIAVRTGHHCTQPLMKRFGVPGTIRASIALYNTKEEIDILYNGILKCKQMLS